MHLDLESGALSGEVLEGPFKDWRLDEMNREQLESLRAYCKANDAESLQLLEGYLEQRFDGSESTAGESAPPPPGGMNRKEALEVLGLGEDADRDAIVDAHRKLMQKLHPDRGGSDYLAAKINQAKDLLLQD
jgi:DnaJ-domain-containing protein 1